MSSGKLIGTVGGAALGYLFTGSLLFALGGGVLGYLLYSLYDCCNYREPNPTANKASVKQVTKEYPMYA